MGKQYYSSTLLKSRDVLESYFDSIIESVNKINDITIKDDWKCVGNEDINKEFNSLKEMTTSIKLCLESYKDFLTTVDTTYTEKSEEINDALKGIDSGS